MTANTGVHTCSYYCERPECVRRQRDELRDRMEAATAELQAEIEVLRTEAEQHFQQAMSNGAKARAAQAQADNLRTEVEALRAEVAEWKRVAAAQAELHDEAEARAERLAEALRKLEEREQRDEALLRQVLEVLSRAHQAAMVQALKARIPECAEFGGIAQDLDFVFAALRERLGEGAEP